jgi:uncharacterized phage-like protein YoqJ
MNVDFVDSNNIDGKICCFSGHRSIEPRLIPLLRKYLRQTADRLAREGIKGFICGGALGFDTLAAETILELKLRRPELSLTLALPFKGQSDRWTDQNRERYEKIRDMADEVIYVSEEYSPFCMRKRNRFMVEHSSACVCYLTGSVGGTAYTVSYALSMGLKVINLAMEL